MNNNISLNLNAFEIFNRLDAKDGISDNSIKAKEWNDFASLVGGKSIKYAILKENAIKSINYYLEKISEETKCSLAEYLNADFSNINQANEEVSKQENLQKQVQKEQQETSQSISAKIDISNKSNSEIFDELDLMDGKDDNLILKKYWDEFAMQFGGKSIQFAIGKENALKSINYYLNKFLTQHPADKKTIQEKIKVANTSERETVEQTSKLSTNVSEKFEQDTLELNAQRLPHSTTLLTIAQDSLGLYEITPLEYERMKAENPEELKNTQAIIVGDYGMRNGHQWCAYTVGYFAQKAEMDMPKLPTVQAYIDKYNYDYIQIKTNKMTSVNYQEERLNRMKQIKAQLSGMHEGDFIIWKGDYLVNTGNSQISQNKASHIGLIEHVDLEKGIVTVIEGNANVNEMDNSNERILIKSREEGKKGAQVIGEYKEVNERDGLIRKQYTVEELAKHGYTGFIDNSSRVK